MLTPNQVIELKTKLKQELARRNSYGSLTDSSSYNYAEKDKPVNYAGSQFDFTTEPTPGG